MHARWDRPTSTACATARRADLALVVCGANDAMCPGCEARTTALADELGTIHVDLANHPAIRDDGVLTGSGGLHGNGRSHAIAAAEMVRHLARAF